MFHNFFLWIIRTFILPLFKSCNHPPIPNLRDDTNDELDAAGLPMGVKVGGRHGVGKSAWLAGHRVRYDAAHPHDASWSLDRSGDYTNKYLAAAMAHPAWPQLRKRIKLVRLGDPRYAVPFPEFSPLYGNTYEEQVQRVAGTFRRLLSKEIETNPTVYGVAVKSVLPALLRLLTTLAAVRPTHEPFQMPELIHLIENKPLLKRAIDKCGDALDYATKIFLINRFLNVADKEAEFRTVSLTTILSDMGVVNGTAHLGGERPVLIPKEAHEKGWIVLVDGSRLMGQKSLEDYLMAQIYALIMEQVVSRTPHHVPNKIALIIDEVRAFLKIPGMSDDVGEISQLWRSRGLIFYLVLQNPRGQLDPNLLKNIWALGNQVNFGYLDKMDCSDAAFQMGIYDPRSVKQPPKTEFQSEITEPLTGQDRLTTDWIAGFHDREMVMRRFISEKKPDPYIRHIRKTNDVLMVNDQQVIEDLKDELLREIGIPVAEVVASVSQRLGELAMTNPKQIPPRAN